MMGEKGKKLVYIGSDHAGFKQKAELKSYIESLGYFVTDIGCFNEESCDYPDIAREVSEKVTENAGAFGVLICGTGEGMAMTANKFKNIRAALATNEELAEMSRKHNDANVLTMGARITDLETMKKITAKFLSTPFESSEERHIRRVNKIGQES